MAKQKKPSGAGKNHGKIAAYYEGPYLRKKLARVIRCSGYAEGLRWAKVNKAEGVLSALERAKNPEGEPLRWLARAKEKYEQQQERQLELEAAQAQVQVAAEPNESAAS